MGMKTLDWCCTHRPPPPEKCWGMESMCLDKAMARGVQVGFDKKIHGPQLHQHKSKTWLALQSTML